MSSQEINKLPDFSDIRENIETERKNIIKVNNFAEDDSYVRTSEDAHIVLDFLESLLTPLWKVFDEYPSLVYFFNNEFTNFNLLIKQENILDLIFIDDCLIPEKEAVFFGQDGGLSQNVLSLHEKTFKMWSQKIVDKHNETQKFIRAEDVDLTKHKIGELKCQCIKCVNDFRALLRDSVYESCVELIDSKKETIKEEIDSGLNTVSDIVFDLQKRLDKSFYKLRNTIKRSSLNRLENQVKQYYRSEFSYPSELAKLHKRNVHMLFDQYLEENELSTDLITDDEYHKFYSSLSTNYWRNERYLIREFKKFVKSIIILKKKDVSSTILQEYLGEFWTHSAARQMKRKIVYHMGPTNSGKTYHAIEKLSSVPKGCYLAPLRLLAAELYDTLNSKGAVTTLLTGEEVIEREGSTHYSSTIEMARLQEVFDCCVIDEIQMITDPSRGWAWTRALVNIMADEVHLCGDASALEMVRNIVDLCGDELIINEYTRMTELYVEPHPIVLADMQKNDALIVFSRKNALRHKRDLERLGYKVSIVYGRLSPEVRREQARKFDQGETDVIVSTDAIAMGMNLPIKRVVFTTLSKFYDGQQHDISVSEIKQIGGRAGRYQRFPKGAVTCLRKVEDGIESIKEAMSAVLDQSEKCMVGPDLDIFNQVNRALIDNNLPKLKLSEFLRLFNTMTFQKPFECVDMKEMIELAEMVEDADSNGTLTDAEIFGFACAPVNLGLSDHVQHYNWILHKYVNMEGIPAEPIEHDSGDIDYLETSIKCVELYQWLSRHFNNKNFVYSEVELLNNKQLAIDQLNELLSQKIVAKCSSCGCKLPDDSKFPICEECFEKRKAARRRPGGNRRGKPGQGGKGRRPGGKNFKGKPNSGQGKRKNVSRKRKVTKR